MSVTNEKTAKGLDRAEYELLVKINEALWNDLLRMKCEFDYEGSVYGGFIVFLRKGNFYSDGRSVT